MENKKIILLIGVLLLVAGAAGYFLIEREIKPENVVQQKAAEKTVKKDKITKNDIESKKEEKVIKADLYAETSNFVPFTSVSQIANLSPQKKQKVDALLELSQGCYYLKVNPDKDEIFVILQNPVMYSSDRYPRHNIQIAVIKSDNTITYENLGFSGEKNEIENAVLQQNNEDWAFDESTEPARPLTHTAYDKKKRPLYSESWNYDSAEPVKYEMKDDKGKVVSVMKDTINGDTEYRQEHIFYDPEGNITKSLTVNYQGADIKWFTYYDAKNPSKSITIESEYNEGLKSAEKVYNQNFKLENILKANYQNGDCKELEVFDSNGEKVMKLQNN